ncbi:MAG TPA: hypothetical protein VI933_01425 [archaeon]|nr:hypothetical protein [archaeon]
MIDRKILWGLLAVLVAFDNIYSYLAIVYHGMREANPITAYFVSISPLYYFLSIPLTLAVLYAVVKFLGWQSRNEKAGKQKLRPVVENFTLTAIVIAWAFVVTLFNFLTFANGFVNPEIRYQNFVYAGVLLSVGYVFWNAYKIQKMKS